MIFNRLKAFSALLMLVFGSFVNAASLSELAAGQLDMAALEGRVVLLDFWASWCGPCRESFPWMNEMNKKYQAQGLSIVAVNVDADQAQAKAFLDKIPADFKVVYDPDGVLAEKMNVEGMPMSFLIDRHGQIRERLVGFSASRKSKHESAIKALLAE